MQPLQCQPSTAVLVRVFLHQAFMAEAARLIKHGMISGRVPDSNMYTKTITPRMSNDGEGCNTIAVPATVGEQKLSALTSSENYRRCYL